jgi:hypothetical protein
VSIILSLSCLLHHCDSRSRRNFAETFPLEGTPTQIVALTGKPALTLLAGFVFLAPYSCSEGGM